MSINYIYLIHPHEFIIEGKNIFKIGNIEAENINKMTEYTEDGVLIHLAKCNNIEKVKYLFKNKFNHLNNEYYEGNFFEMIKIINKFITKK